MDPYYYAKGTQFPLSFTWDFLNWLFGNIVRKCMHWSGLCPHLGIDVARSRCRKPLFFVTFALQCHVYFAIVDIIFGRMAWNYIVGFFALE